MLSTPLQSRPPLQTPLLPRANKQPDIGPLNLDSFINQEVKEALKETFLRTAKPAVKEYEDSHPNLTTNEKLKLNILSNEAFIENEINALIASNEFTLALKKSITSLSENPIDAKTELLKRIHNIKCTILEKTDQNSPEIEIHFDLSKNDTSHSPDQPKKRKNPNETKMEPIQFFLSDGTSATISLFVTLD